MTKNGGRFESILNHFSSKKATMEKVLKWPKLIKWSSLRKIIRKAKMKDNKIKLWFYGLWFYGIRSSVDFKRKHHQKV